MNEERQIDYDTLLHDAFRDAQRGVMRTVLTRVAEVGLPGEHHFYISFNTLAPGVSIAPRLLQKYPNEMTIVLQHRFWDLFVQADRFEVKLTFDGIRERLVVPFTAVRMFFDPSVPYGLQFEEQQDARSTQNGDATGAASGRGSKVARSIADQDRPAGERKKTTRKKDAGAEAAKADLTPVASLASAAPGSSDAPAAADAEKVAKPGPRLVDTANDSAKVVSLDQFRKK